ncbi:MAG: hypothetical protein IPO37_11940 [Saprospiraceae bacterium]|jgi:hypothetical protein|nr:hypothetical protein [Saprospiraceae bacterium]MBP6447235.1 hypothetical protein [Saprospiraceae bacterium]
MQNLYPNSIFAVNFVIFFLLSFCVNAQSRSFAGLPILPSKQEVEYQSNLNHLPEYKRILSIYEKLVEAKGDRRMPVPQLNLRSEEAHVASMDYRKVDISLEKKAYDVAEKYGDEAIAFLLAHELTHYYEKHGWRSDYADAVSDLETGKILNSLNDKILNEVQADVLGGYLAYSAGFGIFEKVNLLFNDLYKSYGMKDKLIGYPSKNDRISLAERNQKQIVKLSNVFEMAGLLTIVGKYMEAYAYYGYLLNKYQSRELYNNAGLTCMMLAGSMLDSESLKFDLPGVMDLEFSGDSRSASTFDQVNKLINEALIHFETCIIMNKTYLPAYINKVSVYILMAVNNPQSEIRNIALTNGNHIIDIELAELKMLHPESDYDRYEDEVLILKSILAYFGNDKSTSINLMTKASDMGNEVAKKNLAILNGSIMTPVSPDKVLKVNIDGMTAAQFLSSDLVSRNQTKIDEDYTFRINDVKTENFRVLTHEYKGDEQNSGFDLGFVVSKRSMTASFLNGLMLGSEKQSALDVLGNPTRSLSHLGGEILYFKDSCIIITNKDNKIEKVIDFKEVLKP